MNLRSQSSPARTGGDLQYHSRTIDLETEESPAFIKLTSQIQEDEPLLLEDFETFLEDLAPRNGEYSHNNFEIRTVNMREDESENGHSHCRHLTIGPSETLPVSDGDLVTGRWQDIFLLELDGPREREVFVQVSGVEN